MRGPTFTAATCEHCHQSFMARAMYRNGQKRWYRFCSRECFFAAKRALGVIRRLAS